MAVVRQKQRQCELRWVVRVERASQLSPPLLFALLEGDKEAPWPCLPIPLPRFLLWPRPRPRPKPRALTPVIIPSGWTGQDVTGRYGVYLRHGHLCAPPDLGVDMRWSRKRRKAPCPEARMLSTAYQKPPSLLFEGRRIESSPIKLNWDSPDSFRLCAVKSWRSSVMSAPGQCSGGHLSAVPCALCDTISLICDMILTLISIKMQECIIRVRCVVLCSVL
jgi:hypothetical protein